MKKCSFVVMNLLITLCLLTGCFRFPFSTGQSTQATGEAELVSAVENLACGENVEYLGNGQFSSLDRDLVFNEKWITWYENGGSFSKMTIQRTELDSNCSKDYETVADAGKDNYMTAIILYWSDDINDYMNGHGFDSAQMERSRREAVCCEMSVEIYLSKDLSPEKIKEINAFLVELRDICIREDEYHDQHFDMRFYVYLTCFDAENDRHIGVGSYTITALSKDEDILLEYKMNPEPAWQVSRSGIDPDPCREGSILIVVS